MVAAAPDPEDPSRTLREVEAERQRQRVVDERLDPYSARYFPTEARTEALLGLIRQEESVENIVRSRTWRLLGERCSETETEWQGALNKWRNEEAER